MALRKEYQASHRRMSRGAVALITKYFLIYPNLARKGPKKGQICLRKAQNVQSAMKRTEKLPNTPRKGQVKVDNR